MIYNPDFDVDAVFDKLRAINDSYPEGSKEDEALRIASVALFYVREIQKLEDYREFFRSFYTPAVDYVVVTQTFATRAEADAWLGGGEAAEGNLVRIAGQGFQVMPKRKEPGLRFVRMPLPEELMKNTQSMEE